jgi:hypothetical protein
MTPQPLPHPVAGEAKAEAEVAAAWPDSTLS